MINYHVPPRELAIALSSMLESELSSLSGYCPQLPSSPVNSTAHLLPSSIVSSVSSSPIGDGHLRAVESYLVHLQSGRQSHPPSPLLLRLAVTLSMVTQSLLLHPASSTSTLFSLSSPCDQSTSIITPTQTQVTPSRLHVQLTNQYLPLFLRSIACLTPFALLPSIRNESQDTFGPMSPPTSTMTSPLRTHYLNTLISAECACLMSCLVSLLASSTSTFSPTSAACTPKTSLPPVYALRSSLRLLLSLTSMNAQLQVTKSPTSSTLSSSSSASNLPLDSIPISVSRPIEPIPFPSTATDLLNSDVLSTAFHTFLSNRYSTTPANSDLINVTTSSTNPSNGNGVAGIDTYTSTNTSNELSVPFPLSLTWLQTIGWSRRASLCDYLIRAVIDPPLLSPSTLSIRCTPCVTLGQWLDMMAGWETKLTDSLCEFKKLDRSQLAIGDKEGHESEYFIRLPCDEENVANDWKRILGLSRQVPDSSNDLLQELSQEEESRRPGEGLPLLALNYKDEGLSNDNMDTTANRGVNLGICGNDDGKNTGNDTENNSNNNNDDNDDDGWGQSSWDVEGDWDGPGLGQDNAYANEKDGFDLSPLDKFDSTAQHHSGQIGDGHHGSGLESTQLRIAYAVSVIAGHSLILDIIQNKDSSTSLTTAHESTTINNSEAFLGSDLPLSAISHHLHSPTPLICPLPSFLLSLFIASASQLLYCDVPLLTASSLTLSARLLRSLTSHSPNLPLCIAVSSEYLAYASSTSPTSSSSTSSAHIYPSFDESSKYAPLLLGAKWQSIPTPTSCTLTSVLRLIKQDPSACPTSSHPLTRFCLPLSVTGSITHFLHQVTNILATTQALSQPPHMLLQTLQQLLSSSSSSISSSTTTLSSDTSSFPQLITQVRSLQIQAFTRLMARSLSETILDLISPLDLFLLNVDVPGAISEFLLTLFPLMTSPQFPLSASSTSSSTVAIPYTMAPTSSRFPLQLSLLLSSVYPPIRSLTLTWIKDDLLSKYNSQYALPNSGSSSLVSSSSLPSTFPFPLAIAALLRPLSHAASLCRSLNIGFEMTLSPLPTSLSSTSSSDTNTIPFQPPVDFILQGVTTLVAMSDEVRCASACLLSIILRVENTLTNTLPIDGPASHSPLLPINPLSGCACQLLGRVAEPCHDTKCLLRLLKIVSDLVHTTATGALSDTFAERVQPLPQPMRASLGLLAFNLDNLSQAARRLLT